MPSIDFGIFNKGITDNYLDADPASAEALDNFLIKDNKKLRVRPGTEIADLDLYQVPIGQQRIGSFPKLENDTLFYQSVREVSYQKDDNWEVLKGPTGNDALPAGTQSNFTSWAEWNGHLLLTSDAFGSIMKVYRDADNELQVRNAGLPKITLVAMISMANDLKAKFNAHLLDEAAHTTAPDTINTVTAPNAYDFPSLVNLLISLVSNYSNHEADAALGSAWQYHAAQETSSHSLTITQEPVTLADCKTLVDHIKAKYNAHDSDDDAHGTHSNYQCAKFSEPQISGGTSASSVYTYYFVAKYRYKVKDVDFIDRGPSYFITKESLSTPNSSTVTISGIPVIINGSTENFDTSNIYWEIYRTEQNGTTAYFLKEVLNGTTSTTDEVSDATLASSTNPVIYTNGGVKDNDPPPQAKFVVIVDDVAWYGHVKEGGQVRKSRIRQSIKFDIDSCPESFFIDLEDELVGMGVIGNYPVAFCKNHIYRIEGQKDIQGVGVISKREIARGVGGINHLSIVNTDKGIFFAGATGIYWTDGFRVEKITKHLNNTYRRLTSTDAKKARVYGLYEPDEDRIIWAMQRQASSTENDCLLVLDLKWPIQPDGVFTFWVPAPGSWDPCALAFDLDKNLIVGDSRGYIFKFDENRFGDPKVDIDSAPEGWGESAIVYDYKGPGLNMGDANNRKIPTYITVVADNVTPLSLSTQRKHDDSGYYKELAEIRSLSNIVWKDPFSPIWNPMPNTFPWRVFPLIIEKRRFPRGNLRCLYTQIRFTNSNTIIYRSDDYGTGVISQASSTRKLLTLDGGNYPPDIVDYFVSFEDDNYQAQYLILERVSDTVLAFGDTGNSLGFVDSKRWVIRGVRKRERFNLNSYSIEFEAATSSHNQYRGDTGGNDS